MREEARWKEGLETYYNQYFVLYLDEQKMLTIHGLGRHEELSDKLRDILYIPRWVTVDVANPAQNA